MPACGAEVDGPLRDAREGAQGEEVEGQRTAFARGLHPHSQRPDTLLEAKAGHEAAAELGGHEEGNHAAHAGGGAHKDGACRS